MKIFDTHAHYNSDRYVEDLDLVINNCITENVDKVCLIGASIEDSISEKKLCLELNDKYNEKIKFYYTLGVHPDDITMCNVDKFDFEAKYDFDRLVNIVNDSLDDKYKTFLAIGEIGLDYYEKEKTDSLMYSQREWFVNQLELANINKLPVVIHSRDAFNDTYDILKNHLKDNKGILHCYSYSKEAVKQFLNMDLYIGVGGVVTFKNGIKLKEVVEYTPIDRMVVETDSPYLSPMPFRGERNDSSKINFIISEIAKIKKLDIEEVAEILYNNACKVYNIYNK